MKYAVEAEHLSFSYSKDGPRTLDDVSFKIAEGEYVALIGHNGSGKSTLARIIAGLISELDPNASLRVFGLEFDKEHSQEIHSKIGLVFQNPDNQFVGATVRDDIAFGLENRAIDPSLMDAIILESASSVGMEEYLDQAPENLSGGQKQRVALAGVLALHPSLLILDEATSMLDPKGKREILALVHKMREDNPSLTVLSITHDVEEAVESDRVLVLAGGKLILEGKGGEVFSRRELLEKNHLESPFVHELSLALRKEGVEVEPTLSEERLLEELCR